MGKKLSVVEARDNAGKGNHPIIMELVRRASRFDDELAGELLKMGGDGDPEDILSLLSEAAEQIEIERKVNLCFIPTKRKS